MKKVVALLLMVACVFCFAACGGEDIFTKYKAALGANTPASVTVSVTATALGVELSGSYDITYTESGANVHYEYEELNIIDPNGGNPAEPIKTVVGDAVVASDGLVSGSLNMSVFAAAELKVNLDGNIKSKREENTAGAYTLIIEVAAADTESVLGVSLPDTTLALSLSADGTRPVRAAYTYVGENGPVSIVCVYN